MEKWEYHTVILYANINHKGVKDYLSKRYPNWKPDKYSPQAMEMYLNEVGEKGWEVIHMQPIFGVGLNSDIHWQGGATPSFSNAYFCVLKRRVIE